MSEKTKEVSDATYAHTLVIKSDFGIMVEVIIG